MPGLKQNKQTKTAGNMTISKNEYLMFGEKWTKHFHWSEGCRVDSNR